MIVIDKSKIHCSICSTFTLFKENK
ncbi:hypothetical protein DVR12_07530 [Chitinophaga silvatica]|uniref:Uncharacterized protein n=1 Tax=Chitinophaga silvatica TaxID=2282649 RepID=A0A3E1YF99_9BACT|nr:hypothetical protein DVR12_07530 [Chitinophaga silvatica]